MNASTSPSPSSPSSVSTPEAAINRKRNPLPLRPILSCGGALLTGAVLVHLLPAPATDSGSATVPAQAVPMMIPASQIVEARLGSAPGTPGRTMHGSWKLTTDVTGRAPVGGEVARWMVEPGSHVQAGDRVVEISTGAATRRAPRAEARQSRAEREQVAAAHGQSALAQNLSLAQTQLADAQERVARAQERMNSVRSLVKRLQAGEKIPVPGSAAPAPRRHRRAREAVAPARVSREEERAQGAASQAKRSADAAGDELSGAQKALGKAQRQADAATSALSKAETDFKAEKTTADVLQNARTAADDAAGALKSAQTRVDVAQKTLATQQEKATAAEAAAKEVRSATPKIAAPVVEETAAPEPEGRYMTADQAATLVADAVRESKAAARQADRIHARVDDYQRQVKQTSRSVEVASKDMQDAQQSVLESVPRAVFASARAPVTGTITWISRLAREVGAGQSVFGISRGKSATLRFEDKSGAWRMLHVGQSLNAASGEKDRGATGDENNSSAGSPKMPESNSPAMPSSTTLAVPPIPATTASVNAPQMVPTIPTPTFSIRITRISPPAKEGEAAQIEAVRGDGNAAAEVNANGVQAQLPPDAVPVVAPDPAHPASARPVVIPLSVVMARDGVSYVAVVSTAARTSQPMTLQWRPVQIERETAFEVEIKAGLHEGERVVDQPAILLSQLRPEEKRSVPVVVEAMD